ncbi:MAG: SDR family NAD(P)-dependent oxidoreductase [Anaerolineales bacterium]|nr:SDR family NAD(P)-dependent oxidoreductase [Anaerolineales bacterium]
MSGPKPVAIVTGASSGIGEATARLLAADGYRVVLAARRLERLEALQQAIAAAGGEALAVRTDVGHPADVQALVERTLAAYGQVDVLFNNAGFGRTKWLDELDPEKDILPQIQVNLSGTILTTRAVLPHMIARRRGHIINMSSLGGLMATPTYSVYAATKYGLRGFSDALRREVGVFGIKVSVVYPGGVSGDFASHTGMQRKSQLSTPRALVLTPQQVAQAVRGLVRRPRRSLVLPWVYRLVVLFSELFPSLNDWVQEQIFTRPERGMK